MAQILTLYYGHRVPFVADDAAIITWLKLSEALARLGHEVDMGADEPRRWWQRAAPVSMAPRLQRVPLHPRIAWKRYRMVHTFLHWGFETLLRERGERHPFLVSFLGSVVGPDDMEGVYFYGERRRRLFEMQRRIHGLAHHVIVLNDAARDLFCSGLGARPNVWVMAAAADRDLPPLEADPFPPGTAKRVLFAGHVYDARSQPQAHATLIDKLNRLGAALSAHGCRVYHLGKGDPSGLDARAVTHVGCVPERQAWTWLRHADVGIVVAAGAVHHNNESTKLYHYLRAGLPTVSESGFPNDYVVRDSGLGFVVPSGEIETMAARVVEAIDRPWDRARAVQYILDQHLWEHRVRLHQRLLEDAP